MLIIEQRWKRRSVDEEKEPRRALDEEDEKKKMRKIEWEEENDFRESHPKIRFRLDDAENVIF